MKRSLTSQKKWSFPLRISSVNVTKISEGILNRKLYFLCSVFKPEYLFCLGRQDTSFENSGKTGEQKLLLVILQINLNQIPIGFYFIKIVTYRAFM